MFKLYHIQYHFFDVILNGNEYKNSESLINYYKKI